jgi:hypothetical protein
MTLARSLVCLTLASIILFAAPRAEAAEPKLLGQYRDWEAYSLKENGQNVCYVASQPTKTKGKYKKRGDIVVLVTHRPARKERDVINFFAGYSFKKGSAVEVKIGGQKFSLFTKADTAWARGEKDERAMVRAMMRGRRMVVTGLSARGTRTADTYSLSGFTRAYKRVSKACGVKPS